MIGSDQGFKPVGDRRSRPDPVDNPVLKLGPEGAGSTLGNRLSKGEDFISPLPEPLGFGECLIEPLPVLFLQSGIQRPIQ